MHKFSAALANGDSAADNPSPVWSYFCSPTNSVCKMEDGSIKNMRVYNDNGKIIYFCFYHNQSFKESRKSSVYLVKIQSFWYWTPTQVLISFILVINLLMMELLMTSR